MQYSQALIKALGDVIYERCLESGQITWHGDFVRILGYHTQEMGENNKLWLARLYPEDKTRVLTEIAAACEHHQPYDIEYRFLHCNGSYIWIQDRGVPHQTTDDHGMLMAKVVGVMRDVSDRKKAEIEMKNALLRERELNQLKTRFIDIASHEFRTPLTSILGFTELLEQYSHKFNPEIHRKHLKRIRSAAERLQELVDDVLSVSRADAANISLELQPLDIDELCRDIFQELDAAFGKTSPLELFLDSQLQGDRALKPIVDARIIRHILTNLLSNALKYSPPHKAIRLEVQYAEQEMTFVVTDQGIGIPTEDLPHLFEPFHRATNVGKIPGTGLGLHIVERYVELHDGAIMVTSTVNAGTTFRVTIPCIFVTDF